MLIKLTIITELQHICILLCGNVCLFSNSPIALSANKDKKTAHEHANKDTAANSEQQH